MTKSRAIESASRAAILTATLCQCKACKEDTTMTAMNKMFSSLEDACMWLYVQGFRQNDAGEWLKGKKLADIRHSPANDGVVAIAISKTE